MLGSWAFAVLTRTAFYRLNSIELIEPKKNAEGAKENQEVGGCGRDRQRQHAERPHPGPGAKPAAADAPRHVRRPDADGEDPASLE